MGVAYETQATVNKPDSNPVFVAIPFISRGFLQKLIVAEQGATDSFTVDVYNQDPAKITTANPAVCHKVIPTQTGSSGVAEYFGDHGLPFHNQDGEVNGKFPDTLYVKISGTPSNKNFTISVAGKKVQT